MSLMDIFGSVPGMQKRPDWMNYEGAASPSMSLAVPDQGAVNYYASQPRQEPKKGGGLGEVLKTLFAGALDGVARHYGFEPGGLNMMKHRMEQEEERKSLMEKLALEEQQYQRRRMDSRADKEWEWGAKPKDPYRTEDNAGNVWEIGPNGGEPTRIFTDRTERVYSQDGQLVKVPNPFTQQQSAPPADPAAILQNAMGRKAISQQDASTIRQSLGPNGQAAYEKWRKDNGIRVIVRTGVSNGRRVNQYDDGTVDYAD